MLPDEPLIFTGLFAQHIFAFLQFNGSTLKLAENISLGRKSLTLI